MTAYVLKSMLEALVGEADAADSKVRVVLSDGDRVVVGAGIDAEGDVLLFVEDAS